MINTTETTWKAPTADTLLDREAIREAMGRYCRGIDRLDVDLIRSAYHEDAFDDHGPFKNTQKQIRNRRDETALATILISAVIRAGLAAA